jgi:TM2 domain-containing membrane protein YozV
MDENLKQQLMFEESRKSTGVSYLLWFFLGGFGAHRFYLGRPISGVAQLALGLFGWIPLFVGWMLLGAWWLVDAFLIPKLVRTDNVRTLQEIAEHRSEDRIEHRTERVAPQPMARLGR